MEWLPQYNMCHGFDSNTELKIMEIPINVSHISAQQAQYGILYLNIHNDKSIYRRPNCWTFRIWLHSLLKDPSCMFDVAEERFWKFSPINLKKYPKCGLCVLKMYAYTHIYICTYLSFHFSGGKMWQGDILVGIFAWLMHDFIHCWIAQS